MSVHCPTPKKFVGSAAAMVSYYAEDSDDAVLKAVTSYYATPKDGVVFQHVGGRAAAHLDGLDLLVGLTREQHAEIHNGRWNGEQLTKGRYSPVWEMDERGHPVKAQNPVTGKWEKVPVMEPAVDDNGEVILDPLTGKQAMRMKVEPATVAGYDIPCTLDKSWAEFVIAHPEHVDLVRTTWLKAVMTGNEWTQDNAQLVVTKIEGTKEKHKADLIWWTVVGNAARPTDETTKRGYGADPHLHAHTFLSSTAYVEGLGWRKIDGEQLYQLAQLRGQVISLTMNKLMEDAGLKIDYALDRKGNYFSQVAGSNEVVRDFFSTNRNRLYDLQWQFERKYGRKPTHQELDQLRAETKVKKSKLAKEADELGNLDQVKRWRAALENAGHELTIADLAEPIQRQKDRKEELHRRLESPGGVARDIQAAAVFGPEVVMPAVIRSAEGLGYGVEDLEQLAEEYINEHLVLARPANDPRHRLYTTETIRAGEQTIAELLEVKGGETFKAVPEFTLMAEMRSLRYSLDPDQERGVRAICGTSGLVHITGHAGAGKSTMCKTAVAALRKAGVVDEVVVVSVARKRAKETGDSVGADKSWSVEALNYAVSKGWKPGKKSLIVFDEIAMANTFEMSRTLEAIQGARFVSVGDSRQLKAIGSAGWYELELAKRGTVELTRNYRQKNPKDIAACEAVRECDGPAAVENFHQRGRIFVAEHREDVVTEARKRYEHWLDRGFQPSEIGFIQTGSNTDTDAINRMAQQVLIDRGLIDDLVYVELVEQSTGRIWRIHQGDRVVANAGFWFENKQNEPILNGTTGTVLGVQQYKSGDIYLRLNLETEDRRQVTVKITKEMQVQPFGPEYGGSAHKRQGGEIPVAINMFSNPGVVTSNEAYSSWTRGQEVIETIIDKDSWGEFPLQRLGEAISREEPKTQASAYLSMWSEYEAEQEREAEQEHQADVHVIEAVARNQETQGLDRGIGI